jgi:hypothetical protein
MLQRIHNSTKAISFALPFLMVVMAGIAWLSFRDCAGMFRRAYHTTILREKDFIDKEVRFRVRIAGSSLRANGREAGFTTVRASDCIDVTIESEDEGSPVQAEEEMEMRIQGASQVIERGPLIDPRGERTGQRAILRLHNNPFVEIVTQHKNDRELFVIRSVSMAHALALERLIRSGYRFDSDGYVVAAQIK